MHSLNISSSKSISYNDKIYENTKIVELKLKDIDADILFKIILTSSNIQINVLYNSNDIMINKDIFTDLIVNISFHYNETNILNADDFCDIWKYHNSPDLEFIKKSDLDSIHTLNLIFTRDIKSDDEYKEYIKWIKCMRRCYQKIDELKNANNLNPMTMPNFTFTFHDKDEYNTSNMFGGILYDVL